MAPLYLITPHQTTINTYPKTYTITYNPALETFLEWIIITYLLWALIYLVYITICGAILTCQIATRTWADLCMRTLVIGPCSPRMRDNSSALETWLEAGVDDNEQLQTKNYWAGWNKIQNRKDSDVQVQLDCSSYAIRRRGGTV